MGEGSLISRFGFGFIDMGVSGDNGVGVSGDNGVGRWVLRKYGLEWSCGWMKFFVLCGKYIGDSVMGAMDGDGVWVIEVEN